MTPAATATRAGSASARDQVADQAVLLVDGPDRPGLVTAITGVLTGLGANIVSLDQHSDDPDGGRFYQRTVFHLADLAGAMPLIEQRVQEEVGDALGMHWRLTSRATPKRVAILASTADHCVMDLLWRQRRGEIPMTVPMVIANHTTVAEDVRRLGVPFFHVPSQGKDKSVAEAEILRLLKGNVDAVVLARYMQILSADLLNELGVPIINIHHSFLPAFIGANPYRQAKSRGVKLIGATAHYVTPDLDEGPIIEQDVVRVSHADTEADLKRRGADVERAVLSRAVLWHCEDRIVRNDGDTIVF